MLSSLIPTRIQRRIAERILNQNLEAISDDFSCRSLCARALHNQYLEIRVCGFELSVGRYLIVPAILELIDKLPYGSSRQQHAIMLLGSFGYSASGARIVKFMNAVETGVRVSAVEELSSHCEPRGWTLPLLRRALGCEEEERVRSSLVNKILEIAASHNLEPFVFGEVARLIEDPSDMIRHQAIRYLARVDHLRDAAVPLLLSRFRFERNIGVLLELIQAIGRSALDEDNSVPVLIAALDCNGTIATAAMDALGNFGPRAKAAVKRLTLELLRPDRERATHARWALKQITDEEALPLADEAAGPDLFSLLFGGAVSGLTRRLTQSDTASILVLKATA